jgi:hypothetical protein
MILITKTIASLNNIEGSHSKFSILAQLKLAEIQSNLDSFIYESLKTLNSLLPLISENGTKEMLLESNILMGKILLKMGSINL